MVTAPYSLSYRRSAPVCHTAPRSAIESAAPPEEPPASQAQKPSSKVGGRWLLLVRSDDDQVVQIAEHRVGQVDRSIFCDHAIARAFMRRNLRDKSQMSRFIRS